VTTPQRRRPPASEAIERISDRNVRYLNARSINSARLNIVVGMFALIGFTAAAAIIGAAFGHATSWGQLSPVIDTLLAGEFAALGAVLAFYMTRQD
jgi:hypothetical protein